MTKLRIDIYSGTIEVDGDVDFVRSVYDDFKDRLLTAQVNGGAAPPAPVAAAPDQKKETPATEVTPAEKPATAVRKKKSLNLSLIKDLDLSDTGSDLSLADFYAAKAPWTAMESNVVFVYYLQRIAGVTSIRLDHIYTCYKAVNVKYPNALKQSLADTSSRKNWLDTSSFEDIKLSAAGENYVEHSLPRRAGQ